jgi:hypothetical protein
MKKRIDLPLLGLGLVAGVGALIRKFISVRSIDDIKEAIVAFLQPDESREDPEVSDGAGSEVTEAPDPGSAVDPGDPNIERRSSPDPVALERLTKGEAARLGMDIEKLKEMGASFQPLIEYLTYIQVQRGDQESLVFVRNDDVDALASLAESEPGAFVEELRKLGVVLSMN